MSYETQSFLAPAKINLFLHVLGRRQDGYHLLQSVFQLIDLNDTLHLKVRSDGVVSRLNSVANVPEEQDLCVRAAKLLQQHTGCTLGVDIQLDKRIPMGAGLGGGSSDAATMLLALNQLWSLHLNRQQLINLGLKLGADVPFFIFGQNAWVEGIGEQLQSVNLKNSYYLLLTPPVHVSTVDIFTHKELTRDTIPTTIAAFSRSVLSGELFDGGFFHNDLQQVVCKIYPQVKECIAWLNQFSHARMSGSGASVFAEFQSKIEAERVLGLKPKEYSGFIVSGISQHPLYNCTS